MTDQEKEARFREFAKGVMGKAKDVAKSVRDVAQHAPKNKARIQQIDQDILDAVKQTAAGNTPHAGPAEAAQAALRKHLEDPAQIDELLNLGQLGIGNTSGASIQGFLRGELPGSTLDPLALSQFRFKNSHYRAGYDQFMQAAGLA